MSSREVFKRVIAVFLVIAFVFSFTACKGKDEDYEKEQDTKNIIVKDALGREVKLPADTENITVASSYGVITPFLATLKIPDRVLAVNFKNKHFYRLAEDPIVNADYIGNSVNLDAEKLASLNPDLYICRISDKENIKIAKRLGISAFAVSAEMPEDVINLYAVLGKILGCEDRAHDITSYLSNELKEIENLTKSIPEDKKVTALCLGAKLSGVAGDDMLQTQLLRCSGATVPVEGIVGGERGKWADCGVEKIFELNPDFIFVTSSAVTEYEPEELYTDRAWSGMSAVKNKNICKIPAKMDSWDLPGPEFVLAMYYMIHCMYPELCTEEMLREKIDAHYNFLYGRTFSGEDIGYTL